VPIGSCTADRGGVTPRSRVRRPLQVGGLLVATAALGTAVAPAASAMVDTAQPGGQAPLQAPAEQPRVLTLAADGFTGTEADPAVFGEGKLQVSIAPEAAAAPSDPTTRDLTGDAAGGAVTGMGGATVVVTVTGVDEESWAYYELGADAEGDTATCTTADDGSCSLTSTNPDLIESGELALVPGMTFVVRQTTAPTSTLYDLPPTGHDVFYGEVDYSRSLAFAPSSSQALTGDASLRFYDPARALAPGAPGGPSTPGTAAGAPAPGSPAAATGDPATATAGASGTHTPGTATTNATPALATTGADVGPMAAVGGGLLVAGAAGLVLARRRVPR